MSDTTPVDDLALATAAAEQRELYQLTAHVVRGLAMDAVQKANSGHPGMPMGMADATVLLWHRFLKHNPADPHWPDRDRFVLSAGHGSMLLYSLLHLTGYPLTMADIQAFRQWDSLTPGHPESHLTAGVETTTGPLGQGLSNAVGMALAEQWLAARFNQPNLSIVDHYTYVIASDGDLMEGVTHEACALAGHWGLHKLIVLYDDNGITIDGATELAFTEDVAARFAAYGWQTEAVNGHDITAVAQAIQRAQEDKERPSLILCRTQIGYGSPNKAGTASAHGEPLGEEEIKLTKEALGLPPDRPFYLPESVLAFMRQGLDRGQEAQDQWERLFAYYQERHPELAAAFRQAISGELPGDWTAALPTFEPGKSIATRNASGTVLDNLVPTVPTLLGGSADLTGSNKTKPKGKDYLRRGQFDGRYIYYGVREHGMGAIMNGLSLHGGVRPYGGTFLVFSDYMRGAIRLAALMAQPVIYVFSHDSIGLGEDGPTHQPVEQLLALRAIPNLTVFRPADANETVVAWQVALENRRGPTALILTRQNLPVLPAKQVANARRGAYILRDAPTPQALLMASGSEVHIALEAQQMLADMGIEARVVSMPSWKLFAAQPRPYQTSVLAPHIKARVAIEAGISLGWEGYVGPNGRIVGLDRFGASAPYETLYRELGITAEAVVTAVRQMLS
jgi:transketolase